MECRQGPSKTFSVILPIDLMERIKDAARLRAVHECRHVPYVEVLRGVLEREFPAQPVAAPEQ